MNQALLLKLHRWITLVFALPLLIIIGTGLLLSFQPIVQTAAITPGAVTLPQLESLFAKYDPKSEARGLSIDPYENTLSLDGVGADGSTDVSLATGEEAEDDSRLTEYFSAARRIHRQILNRMNWLVNLSTGAMLVLAALGIAMGWPRIRNNLSGWHKGTAWFLLPLVILSPLTGLFLAFNVTIGAAPPARVEGGARSATGAGPTQARPKLLDVLKMVAGKHDLSSLVAINVRGGRLLARVNDDGVLRAYTVTPQGLVAAPTNWARAIHEGTFAGIWSGLMNVITSIALLGLLFTGLTIWARRKFRRLSPRNPARPGRSSAVDAAPAE